LLILVLASFAVVVSAQEVTVEPTLPVEVTVEVTVQPTIPATTEPTAQVTSVATTEPTMEATEPVIPATEQPTMQATTEATPEMAVTAEMTTTPGDNNAFLRIADFAPDSGSVDAYLNDTRAVGRLTFPSVSEWIPVAPGKYSINVKASGDATSPAFTPVTVNAAANTWQTIAIVPAGAGLQAAVISEDYSELLPSTGGFTFFNALEGSAPINLVRGNVVYFAQLGFPAENTKSSASLPGDSGKFDISAVDPNDPSKVFASTNGLNLRENAYTLVALIGPASAPRLFTFVTDESAVEIARGLLPKPGKLMDALRANQNLTTFADALQTAGLADMLNGSAEYTNFRPGQLRARRQPDAQYRRRGQHPQGVHRRGQIH